MNKIVKNLAENIKKRRIASGLSQEQLADKSGLHRTYIGSVERCERNITIQSLDSIAKALGVQAYELLMESKK